MDHIVKNTDVLASTPSGAVSRRIEDAKRWATRGDALAEEAKANLSGTHSYVVSLLVSLCKDVHYVNYVHY